MWVRVLLGKLLYEGSYKGYCEVYLEVLIWVTVRGTIRVPITVTRTATLMLEGSNFVETDDEKATCATIAAPSDHPNIRA